MAQKKEKGKKGGGKAKGKVSGPTPEEKLQQLMAKLREDEKLSVLSIQKLNFERIGVLRKQLKTDLRKDIDLSKVIFEKVLKIKDNIIKSLADDLNNSEQQAVRAQVSHLEFQDTLQTLQVERLAALDQLWRGGQQELSAELNSERDEMLVQHREEIDYLKDVCVVMRKRDCDMRDDASLNYQSLCNALQRLQITKRDLAAKHLVEQITKRDLAAKHLVEQQKRDERDELKPDEDTYEKAEAEFKVALKAMDERCCTKGILATGRRLRGLQKMRDTMVLQLQVGSGEHGNQRERETAEMRASVGKVAMKATRVKVRMSRERRVAKERLTRLVMNTSTAEKKLRDTRTKGERLLFRFQMCANIDSKQVKVLPSSSKEEVAQATDPPPREIAEEMAEYRELEQFWQRYNKVRLEQLYLKKEQIALTRENKYLHALVRSYTHVF